MVSLIVYTSSRIWDIMYNNNTGAYYTLSATVSIYVLVLITYSYRLVLSRDIPSI